MYSITTVEQPDIEVIKTLRYGIRAFNENILKDRYKSVAILLNDKDEKIVGGIIAYVMCKSYYIEVLWVQEKLRGQGYGTQLMQAAEQEALREECHTITLDILGFHPQDFYLKLGFEKIGEIPNYMCNHPRVYFRKKC